jgi:hypothetical protein
MPSGPPELHEKWCGFGPFKGFGDSNALKYLRDRGLQDCRGVFRIPRARVLTDEESSALDYLFMEWDYASEIVP